MIIKNYKHSYSSPPFFQSLKPLYHTFKEREGKLEKNHCFPAPLSLLCQIK